MPIRAPVSDVISHLVKRGHNDARVTRFAQMYLKNLENFVSNPSRVGIIPTTPANRQSDYAWLGIILFKHTDIPTGRELLNETLYRCMSDGTTRFLIPPLALYMLSVAQQDGSDTPFEPYIKLDWPDHYFLGFERIGEATAEVFSDPYFINQNYATKFINSRQKKGIFGSVTRESKREMESASRLVRLISELRYTMDVLAKESILVDTGQYQPKYQNRTFADMENEIARDLTNQPNFETKVKLLSGECVVKTNELPIVLSGERLSERIEKIKRQMRKQGYCRYYKDVEREIRERHERLRGVMARPGATVTSDEPPPAYY